MSDLSNYELQYEDMAFKTPKTVGRTVKMSKTTNENTSKKKYSKTRGEHLKDIVIAILVTAMVGFVTGMQFANSNTADKVQAVEKAQAEMATPVETPVKK